MKWRYCFCWHRRQQLYFVTRLVNGGTDDHTVTTRFGGCALEGGPRLRELCVFGDGADHPLFGLA
ncbi:MAG: hypothetical protein VYB43_01705, partial [Pseudomonadota bacterium]|nr:hypothetical protein [Pseudomonadota bacterium]